MGEAGGSGEPDEDFGVWDQEAAWAGFGSGLGRYLDQVGVSDHLVIAVPGPTVEPCAPYLTIGGTPSEEIYLSVPADSLLLESHRIGAAGAAWLLDAGFLPDESIGWLRRVPSESFADLAQTACSVLRIVFAVPHPGVLGYDVVGPAAETADRLGLDPSAEITVEREVDRSLPEGEMSGESGPGRFLPESVLPELFLPEDFGELRELVTTALDARWAAGEPDSEGDIRLLADGLVAWLRVRTDQPALEIVTPVVHEVRSRRGAAVELAVLNRTNAWVKWSLHGRSIYLVQLIHAYPFVPMQMNQMIELYFDTLADSTDDLVLRVGGRKA